MPYFTRDYCDQFVGKTIAKIDPIERFDCQSITIHFTDGTKMRIDACVEHEEKPQRSLTLIVNKS